MIFIYFITLSLPAYLIKFSIFGLKTNLLDIFLILFFGGWFLRKVLKGEKLKESFLKIKDFLLPMTLLLLGVSIATLKSSDILASLGILKSWFVLPILFFIAASDIIKTEKQKISILKIWFLGGILVALIGLVYYFLGKITYDERLRAFFLSPNHLAMFLAGPFIVGVFMLANGKWQMANGNANKGVFLSMAVIFIGVIIFLTKSLGGMLAIFVSLLPVFYRQIKNSKSKIIAFLILLPLVFSILFLVLGKDFSKTSSLASRFIIWRSSLKILGDNIIFGIGPGIFQEKYLEYQKYFEPYLEKNIPQPHNIFLAFWLQSGIIGTIGFLLLIFIFFKNVWKYKENEIIILCAALLIYNLTHGLIDTLYWKNDLAMIFWLIILLSLPILKTSD